MHLEDAMNLSIVKVFSPYVPTYDLKYVYEEESMLLLLVGPYIITLDSKTLHKKA